MAHKQIKLNENDFKKLVKEAVKKAVKAKLNEGFADKEMDEKWIDAERQLGSKNMLQEVYNYFDSNQLTDFLRSIDQDYGMGLFEDTEDEEEYDDSWVNTLNEGLSSPTPGEKGAYRGVPGTVFVWRGEYSDPLVRYKGKLLNANDIEDALWNEYKEQLSDSGVEDPKGIGFEDFVEKNGVHYIEAILDDMVV